MNQNHRENLSAGMDGELSVEELRFLLRRIDHDPALQDDWDRFHVASGGLRRELPVLASSGFSARVMTAIEVEARGSSRQRRGHWLRLSAGGAIAASVAVVALMASQPSGNSRDGGVALRQPVSSPSLAQVPTPAPAPAVAPAVVPTWLSSNDPFRYSQRASFAAPGGPANEFVSPYAQPLSPYQVKGYRTLQNGDGSYLLLVDPTRRAERGAATAQ